MEGAGENVMVRLVIFYHILDRHRVLDAESHGPAELEAEGGFNGCDHLIPLKLRVTAPYSRDEAFGFSWETWV